MRRDELRIFADMLRQANEETISSIANHSNMNFQRCRAKLEKLVENNLVREKEIPYETTDGSKVVYLRTGKGDEFLERFGEIKGMLG